jgi:signal transduction histidine kinase
MAPFARRVLTTAMVRLHEAELGLSSRLGEGTTLTVTFPASRTTTAVEAAD